MTSILPREDYDHPGPLGPALDLSRITGWNIHQTAGSLTQTPFQIADYTRRKWGRSSYNFLISQKHSHGDVFEMQGLHRGAHTEGENPIRLGIVLVGYYHPSINHKPSPEMLEAVAWLMAYGNRHRGIPIHAKGHRDAANASTACPGDHIHDLIPSIVKRAKELAMSTDHDHNLTKMPDWGGAEKRYWDKFVADKVTSVQKSWAWVVHRIDLAWIYSEVIIPIRNTASQALQQATRNTWSITDLARRVTDLENGRSISTSDVPSHNHDLPNMPGVTGDVKR